MSYSQLLQMAYWGLLLAFWLVNYFWSRHQYFNGHLVLPGGKRVAASARE